MCADVVGGGAQSPNARYQTLQRLKSERERRLTFTQWPHQNFTTPTTDELARAGFFFFNRGDGAQCAYCLGVLHNWREGHNAVSRHMRHFPNCSFVRCMPVGNIPINPFTGEEIAADDLRAQQVNLLNLRLVRDNQAPMANTGTIQLYIQFEIISFLETFRPQLNQTNNREGAGYPQGYWTMPTSTQDIQFPRKDL